MSSIRSRTRFNSTHSSKWRTPAASAPVRMVQSPAFYYLHLENIYVTLQVFPGTRLVTLSIPLLSRSSQYRRSIHPYFHTESSCSKMANNRWCSWVCKWRPYHNTTQTTPHSRRWHRLLQRNAEPVVGMGPSQPSLANHHSFRRCCSRQWAWKPCIHLQRTVSTEER